MLTITFGQSAIDAAVVSFGPATITVSGRNATEKRVAIAMSASSAAQQFLISQGGKVGKAAASSIVTDGIRNIATSARSGNYKPLAEAMACILAESVFITSRASFDGLGDVLASKLADVGQSKNQGYMPSGKMGSKLRNLTQAMMLVVAVKTQIADASQSSVFNTRTDAADDALQSALDGEIAMMNQAAQDAAFISGAEVAMH